MEKKATTTAKAGEVKKATPGTKVNAPSKATDTKAAGKTPTDSPTKTPAKAAAAPTKAAAGKTKTASAKDSAAAGTATKSAATKSAASQKEKAKSATPVEPYKGNSKLKGHSRLTAAGNKPE